MKKILIIEDQAPMRRNLALMLEMEGFEVRFAENGKDRVEMVLRPPAGPFDLRPDDARAGRSRGPDACGGNSQTVKIRTAAIRIS
ncbi:MAG: response regulator [Verrucomicrobiota bacterium]